MDKLNNKKTKAVKRLEARGFGRISETATGMMLGLVDSSGLVYKVKVNRNGRIRRYKATKATDFERRSLPKINDTFSLLPNGNLV